MKNENINVRNMYIDLLNKMKALDAVDQAYIDHEIDKVKLLIAELGLEIELLNEIKADYDMFIATDTGNPLTIYALNRLSESLKVTLKPIQDLHGYYDPWVGGAGKNKLPMTLSGIKSANTSGSWNGNVYTYHTVEITINTDNGDNVVGINVNGTNDGGEFMFEIGRGTFDGDYILNGCPVDGSQDTFKIRVGDASNNFLCQDIGSGVDYIYNNVLAVFQIYVGTRKTVSNKTFYPMIRLSTESDDSFVPYSNICPITGRTETTLTDTDGEDDQYLRYDFGQTVYGCKIDFKTGKVVMDKGYIVFDGSDDENWVYYSADPKRIRTTVLNGIISNDNSSSDNKTIISNEFPTISNEETYAGNLGISTGGGTLFAVDGSPTMSKASFISFLSSNPLQVCYKLATPVELQLTPAELELFKGYNYLTADGEIEISYIPENVINYIKSL